MAIIYGSSFAPLKESKGEVKFPLEETKETGLFTFLQVLSAVVFIALSFIPVVGEGAIAGEVALEGAILTGEAAAEATVIEGAELAIAEAGEFAIEGEAGAELSEITSVASKMRLGNTKLGSVALGLTEAGVNAGIEEFETGDVSLLGVGIDLVFAFTPLIGISRAEKANKIRVAGLADKQIRIQQEIINNTTDALTIEKSLRRIDQLKKTKIAKLGNNLTSSIDSRTVKFAREEIGNIVGTSLEKQTVKKVTKKLTERLAKTEYKLAKHEARDIVKGSMASFPEIQKGLTLDSVFRSKIYKSTITALSIIDPNLAARKGLTYLTRFLTSDKPLIQKKLLKKFPGLSRLNQMTKKINIGLYKKFGRKLNKFWEKWGKKVAKQGVTKMIPVSSQWIAGFRSVVTAVPDTYVLVIFFKVTRAGRYVPPVSISPIGIERISEFIAAASKGSYYIDNFALARNGVAGSLTSTLGGIGFGLPLGKLRQALRGPAAFERAIKDVSRDDYFETYFDKITETTNRLWTHKVGKVFAGRWGIAIARGFQRSSTKGVKYVSVFDPRHLIEEAGVVTLDKARAVQRAAGIRGRTRIIGAKRQKQAWQRTIKLGTFGRYKFDSHTGIKKGNNPLLG